MSGIFKDWVAWGLMAVLIFGICWGGFHGRSTDRKPTIDYRGEQFKLTKTYGDYDDYKNDPENLDFSENERVEQAVTQATLAFVSDPRTNGTSRFRIGIPWVRYSVLAGTCEAK